MFDPITLCSVESYSSVDSKKDKYIEMQPWQYQGQNGHEPGMGSSTLSCLKLSVRNMDPGCDFSYSNNCSLAAKARKQKEAEHVSEVSGQPQ